jgi:hypothetical protein
VDSQFRFKETYLRVRFQVESAIRGVAVGTVEVTTSGNSGSGCGYPFEMNGRYVVYAGRGPDNALETSLCSRTRRVENAVEDLSLFGSLATAPPVARVFGQLGLRESAPLLSDSRLGPLAGARVILEGRDGTWETVSDKDGRYQFVGLPAGSYEVKLLLAPESMAQFHPPSIKVKLVERGCAVANAYAQVQGRISGTLSDAEGRPVPARLVEILPEAMSPLESRTWELPSAVTAEDGHYQFENLPSGRYVVGVNLRSSPHPLLSEQVVYPRTYFPSAVVRSEAQVVELTAGGEQRGVDIVLPGPLKKREVHGIVVWSDGKRAKGVNVLLSNPEYGSFNAEYGQSDADGAFSIAGYEDLPYVIVASSSNDSNGKPLRGGLNSLPTPVKGEQTIVTLPDPAALKGRIVDSRGRPLPKVEVELIFEEARGWEAARKSPYSLRATSDPEGRFEITGLSPRRYVLAVHASSPPRSSEETESEYPPAFYPGTGDRNLASVIEIKEGQQAELLDFVMPERLTPETVEGIVVWPDDRAVQGGSVLAEDGDFPGWTYVASVPIAPDGRFALPLFAGRHYVIRAVTNKDQQGRESLWPIEIKPVEVFVNSQSKGLTLRMSALP